MLGLGFSKSCVGPPAPVALSVGGGGGGGQASHGGSSCGCRRWLKVAWKLCRLWREVAAAASGGGWVEKRVLGRGVRDDLALSSAKASQKALWVMKLSLLQ